MPADAWPHGYYSNRVTCDDVLDGAVLPFVNVPAVFALLPSELRDQLLLLPLAFVRWRLGGRGKGQGPRVTKVQHFIRLINRNEFLTDTT